MTLNIAIFQSDDDGIKIQDIKEAKTSIYYIVYRLISKIIQITQLGVFHFFDSISFNHLKPPSPQPFFISQR